MQGVTMQTTVRRMPGIKDKYSTILVFWSVRGKNVSFFVLIVGHLEIFRLIFNIKPNNYLFKLSAIVVYIHFFGLISFLTFIPLGLQFKLKSKIFKNNPFSATVDIFS